MTHFEHSGAKTGTVLGVIVGLIQSMSLETIMEAVIMTSITAFFGAIVSYCTVKLLKKVFGDTKK